ncbi:MAG: aquaporin family protein [Alphaproteobacteria bacterium]|nr:aquaporin family protein [Alphaproteobacteria bacterium]
MQSPINIARRLTAEFIGSAYLLAAVIGSGIMSERLAGGNTALALLGNTMATGAILVVLILIFRPVSGAHFNPAVTLAFRLRGAINTSDTTLYILAQITGALSGMLAAHFMFEVPLLQVSTHMRAGMAQFGSEVIATFGLLAAIFGCVRYRSDAVPYAVGLYITAAYWFTSSTSFANPSVTLARSFTDSFSGIRLEDAPLFILAQLIGAVLATALFGWLFAPENS